MRQVSTTTHRLSKCRPSRLPTQSLLEVMTANSAYTRGEMSVSVFFSIVMREKRLSSQTCLEPNSLPSHAYNANSGAISSSSFLRSFLLIAWVHSLARATSLVAMASFPACGAACSPVQNSTAINTAVNQWSFTEPPGCDYSTVLGPHKRTTHYRLATYSHQHLPVLGYMRCRGHQLSRCFVDDLKSFGVCAKMDTDDQQKTSKEDLK